MTDLLRVEGLTRHFGGLAAIVNLHFRVKEGEKLKIERIEVAGRETLHDDVARFPFIGAADFGVGQRARDGNVAVEVVGVRGAKAW